MKDVTEFRPQHAASAAAHRRPAPWARLAAWWRTRRMPAMAVVADEVEANLANARVAYVQADSDEERAEILAAVIGDWYATWPESAVTDPDWPLAYALVRVTGRRDGVCFSPRTAKYVIWSNQHGAWWGPSRRGYTQWIEEAGRYALAEAEAIVQGATLNGQLHEMHLSRLDGQSTVFTAPEVVMLAPETLRDHAAAPAAGGVRG